MIVLLAVAGLTGWIVRVAGWRFAARRLGSALLIVVVVTFAVSALLRQASTDDQTRRAIEELGLPAASGPCIISLGTAADAASVLDCVDERGLDDNVFAQYATWAGEVMSGDLGYASYRTREPLAETFARRLPRTLLLFVYSQIIALALAVPLGIWSAHQATRPGRPLPVWGLPVGVALLAALAVAAGWSVVVALAIAVLVPVVVFAAYRGGSAGDATVNATAFVLLSIPVFVLAETLRYACSIEHDWYQLSGYAPWSEGVGAHLGSIWLPALVLALAAMPVYVRLLRADMIQNLQHDFVAVARAKGMSDRHVLFRHVLRPSTLTLLTVAGLNIAQLVNGAIVVEFIFDIDGMGSFLIDAVLRNEFFAIQTIVAVGATMFVVANTIVDLLYTAVDPRVRREARR